MSARNRSPAARPRGRLPQRVYWFRRTLVLLTALAMVYGVAHLLGAGGGASDGTATITAAHPRRTVAPAPTRVAGPVVVATTPARAGSKRHQQQSTPVSSPLATPSGPCNPADILVTPQIGRVAAGGPITITLGLTGTQPACTFTVSPRSVVLKVTSGSDGIWSSQDCPKSIPTRTVAVRSTGVTRVPVTWSGRRSDAGCSRTTGWADPGYYHALAAAMGSQPSDVQFRLSLPSRPVVTKTAHPKQTKSAKPSGTASPRATASPTGSTGGKQSACGGDNVCPH